MAETIRGPPFSPLMRPPQMLTCKIMLRTLRQLLLVLIAFAVAGAPMAHAAQSQYGSPMAMAGMPCDMMMDAGHAKPQMPCKGLTPECVKQMGCITDIALPARLVGSETVVDFSTVDYWTASSTLAGLVRGPEPFPPRTI
jgi:hypothetical protein